MNTSTALDTSRSSCRSKHSFGNKISRVVWGCCWLILFRPSPRLLFRWRVLLLKIFGADVTWHSRLDPSVRIWAPWNLSIGAESSVGHHVDIYNLDQVFIGSAATVSQYAFLCAGSHELSDPRMELTTAPVRIDDSAWVCAKAYVGPGVHVGSGAVVGACAVAVKDVPDWMIVAGNPAKQIRRRELV